MIVLFSINSDNYMQSRYVIKLLKDLTSIAEDIYVCTSYNIDALFLDEIKNYSQHVIQYDDYVDVNRWKDIIMNRIGRKRLETIDEIIFVNDSVFGPIYPVEKLIEKCRSLKGDFWGLTAHGRMIKHNRRHRETWPRFIQTYFFGVRQPMLGSVEFIDYIFNLKRFKDFHESSEGFEYVFTDYFEKKGYEWTVLCNTEMLEKESPELFMSFILFDLHYLIAELDFPFVPKVIFDLDTSLVRNFHDGNDLRRVIDYIENETTYNTQLIYENIIPRFNLHDLINRLNLNYILADTKHSLICTQKCAMFVFLYYEDLFDKCLQRLKMLPVDFDIYISTDSLEKAKIIEDKMAVCNRFVTVSVKKERGRDLSALLVHFRPYIMNYDIIGFIHDKKSSQMDYPTVGQTFFDYLWENMISSEDYVARILELFEKHPEIGLLVPPMISHGTYFHTMIDAWTICFDKTIEVAEKIGCNINIDMCKNPVALGSVFYCRTKALAPVFEFPFSYEDFPEEPMPVDGTFSHAIERIFPYVAQTEGYVTGNIMNLQTAAMEYKHQSETINQIMRQIDTYEGVNTATLETTIASLKGLKHKRKKKGTI